MQTTTELAQLADRSLHAIASLSEECPRPFWVVVDVVARQAQVDPDRDQLLLHAVVEVAFDAAPLVRHRVEDVLALQ